MDSSGPAIVINSLSAGYGKTHILFDVDFEAKNEITAIVGANGSGKSTLLKSMFGLCDVFSGTVRFGDLDITGIATHQMYKHHISYMAQRSNIFADLTIRENLTVSNLGNRDDVVSVYDLFPELKSKETQKAGTLSGGQRQLLAMAMAIITKPQVILFDEPTAGLSPKNAQHILDKIGQIRVERDVCVILVEQSVKRALNFCDTAYLLASGSVIYSGPPGPLLADKDLAKKYLGV